jgi:CBS domain-containing protein
MSEHSLPGTSRRDLDRKRYLILPRLKENSMKKCQDVMTQNPVCCLPEDAVAYAAHLMETENIGSIPVIEDRQSEKLVGIVTDRDLALKIVGNGHDVKSTKVKEVMTRQLVTCRPGDDVQKALDAMAKHQLRRIPVVDSDTRIIGIIAQADVATRVNQPEKTAKVVREVSQA